MSYFVGLDCTACTGRDAFAGSDEEVGVVACGKFGNLVLVPGDVEVGRPCEILSDNRAC